MIDTVKHEDDIRKSLEWWKGQQAKALILKSEKLFNLCQGWIDALLWILDEENTAPKGELK